MVRRGGLWDTTPVNKRVQGGQGGEGVNANSNTWVRRVSRMVTMVEGDRKKYALVQALFPLGSRRAVAGLALLQKNESSRNKERTFFAINSVFRIA